MAKWRAKQSEIRNDGSGQISLEIVGIDNLGNEIPNRHTWVLLDGSEVQVALALTPKTAVVAAMKALIGNALPDGWLKPQLDAIVAANAESIEAKDDLDTFVSTVGNYPVTFNL